MNTLSLSSKQPKLVFLCLVVMCKFGSLTLFRNQWVHTLFLQYFLYNFVESLIVFVLDDSDEPTSSYKTSGFLSQTVGRDLGDVRLMTLDLDVSPVSDSVSPFRCSWDQRRKEGWMSEDCHGGSRVWVNLRTFYPGLPHWRYCVSSSLPSPYLYSSVSGDDRGYNK